MNNPLNNSLLNPEMYANFGKDPDLFGIEGGVYGAFKGLYCFDVSLSCASSIPTLEEENPSIKERVERIANGARADIDPARVERLTRDMLLIDNMTGVGIVNTYPLLGKTVIKPELSSEQ